MSGFEGGHWSKRPAWTWSAREHQEAFEAHQRAEGKKVLAELARTRGLLWDSRGLGYGGSGRWPFDIRKAIAQPGYCKGVVHASKSSAFDSVWRDAAKRDIVEHVYPIVAQIAEAMEAAAIMDEHGL